MDSFQKRALKTYWEITVEFLEFVKAGSAIDDVGEIEDMLLFTNNIVLTNEAKMLEGADAWLECMLEPLDSKKVKYAKALDRILSAEAGDVKQGIVFHAAQFRDLDGLLASTTSQVMLRLDLKQRIEGWDDEKIATLWKYVSELNRAVFETTKRTMPRTPTREEIQRNIKSKRGDSAAGSISMQRAFIVAYNALLASRNGSGERIDDTTATNVKTEIAERITKDADALDVIQKRDDAARTRAATILPGLNLASGEELSKSDWDLTIQLCTLCRVESAVPSNVMAQVETFAQRLASDMMSGKRDLTSMQNLEAIGEELMSGIDPADIAKLTNGVDALLPALNMLKNTI